MYLILFEFSYINSPRKRKAVYVYENSYILAHLTVIRLIILEISNTLLGAQQGHARSAECDLVGQESEGMEIMFPE
ncbi:hypothetical protein YSY43_37660 [Paenibacillus sp. YSY-4.3]